MPVSLVSALMLQNRKGISEEQLTRRFQWLHMLILERGYRVGGANEISPRASVDSVIALFSSILAKSKYKVFELSLQPSQKYENVLLLSYYRNMLLHVFTNEALVCLCLAAEGQEVNRRLGLTPEALKESLGFLRRLLQREVFEAPLEGF